MYYEGFDETNPPMRPRHVLLFDPNWKRRVPSSNNQVYPSSWTGQKSSSEAEEIEEVFFLGGFCGLYCGGPDKRINSYSVSVDTWCWNLDTWHSPHDQQ